MRVTAAQVSDRPPVVRTGPICRLLTLAAALLAAAQAPIAQSQAGGGSEAAPADAVITSVGRFVETFAARGAAVLRDTSLTPEARDDAFRAMLLDGFDTYGGARFALGRGWPIATPAQREEFVALFRQELLRKGKQLFEGYEGEVLEVQRVQPFGPDKLMVETKLSNPAARINDIDFVVRPTGDRFQIVDVRLEGFSMLDAYRSRFIGPLMQGGVEAVLRSLRERSSL